MSMNDVEDDDFFFESELAQVKMKAQRLNEQDGLCQKLG